MRLKERILHEALRQFSAKGFMATSTTDIITAVGTSKGGLYNHFQSKDQLFLEALSHARKIWRERNLFGLEEIERPCDKIIQLLTNYKDRYLVDTENIPGGCIFINLTVELSDQHPHLAEPVAEGLERLKGMLKRLLEQERTAGTLKEHANINEAVDMLFSGLLGACIMYTADKSKANLDSSIGSLCSYVKSLTI